MGNPCMHPGCPLTTTDRNLGSLGQTSDQCLAAASCNISSSASVGERPPECRGGKLFFIFVTNTNGSSILVTQVNAGHCILCPMFGRNCRRETRRPMAKTLCPIYIRAQLSARCVATAVVKRRHPFARLSILISTDMVGVRSGSMTATAFSGRLQDKRRKYRTGPYQNSWKMWSRMRNDSQSIFMLHGANTFNLL